MNHLIQINDTIKANDNDKQSVILAEQVDRVADYLVAIFKSPDSRAFYCKAA